MARHPSAGIPQLSCRLLGPERRRRFAGARWALLAQNRRRRFRQAHASGGTGESGSSEMSESANREVRILKDGAAIAKRAAEKFLEIAKSAVAEKGSFTVA